MIKKIIIFLSVLLVFTLGASVKILEPTTTVVSNGSTLELGAVGPGQKITLVTSTDSGAETPQKIPADWDVLEVKSSSLPLGWHAESSKTYENPLRAHVFVSKNAKDGVYTFSVQAIDELQGVSPVNFNVRVNVSREIMELNVLKNILSTGAKQPATLSLLILNKGRAGDVFRITIKGLPEKWKRPPVDVYVPHDSAKLVQVEILPEEQGQYAPEVGVVSLSSPLISDKSRVTLIVKSSLYEDLKATSHGLLLFPTVEQSIYYLIGFLVNSIS